LSINAGPSHSTAIATNMTTAAGQRSRPFMILLVAGVATLTVDHIKNSSSSLSLSFGNYVHGGVTQCAAAPYNQNNAALAKSGGDVVMLGPTKEKATGILFPNLCNAMTFVGCGVRIKYGFVKVYAVGTYMDPIAMAAVKSSKAAVESALLDPSYPRTIRIVMNRSLSMDKYIAAIVEALTPRMNGQDLDKLEEFKAMNPKVDLIEGAEMEMTIRGHVMLYKNALGGVGQIDSRVFCEALCDVYYGKDPVSPGHKEEVIRGVMKM